MNSPDRTEYPTTLDNSLTLPPTIPFNEFDFGQHGVGSFATARIAPSSLNRNEEEFQRAWNTFTQLKYFLPLLSSYSDFSEKVNSHTHIVTGVGLALSEGKNERGEIVSVPSEGVGVEVLTQILAGEVLRELFSTLPPQMVLIMKSLLLPRQI